MESKMYLTQTEADAKGLPSVQEQINRHNQAIRDLKHAGGRPPGVAMPCGWGCGKSLTASEMREHFTTCPSRPAERP